MESKRTFSVVIIPGKCWGSIVCEDTGVGACQLCVDLCPEVFEKPIVNFCAFVRPDADVTLYENEVHNAVLSCPVEAIEVMSVP